MVLKLKLAINFLLIGMLIIGCQSSSNSDSKLKSEIKISREILHGEDMQNTISSKEKKLIDKYPDTEVLLLLKNKVNDENSKYKEQIRILDSLQNKKDFDQLKAPTKFYIYYKQSMVYANIVEPYKSMNSLMLAQEIIDISPTLFNEEYLLLERVIEKLKKVAYQDLKRFGSSRKKNVEQINSQTPLEEAAKLYYNYSLELVRNEDYYNSLKYAKKAVRSFKEAEVNVYIPDNYSVIQNNYAKLNMKDSVFWVDQTIEKFYKDSIIDLSQYNQYKVFAISGYLGIKENAEIEKLLKELALFYRGNCMKLYMSTELNDMERKYFRYIEDVRREKAILIDGLSLVNQCDIRRFYLIEFELKILNRLIEIDMQAGNTEELKQWFEKKNNLRAEQRKYFSFAAKLNHFLMERDQDYAQLNIDGLKAKVAANDRLKVLFIFLIFLLVAASVNIIYLYLRNLNFNKKLSESLSLLRLQNQKITQQNSQMSSLVMQLSESNENLENFARVAAHDIKSPISSIHSTVNYLWEQYKPYIKPKDKKLFSNLNASTISLSNMINVLLNYSSKSQKLEIIDNVDLVPILNKINRNIQLENMDSEIELVYADYFPPILANTNLIEQLFTNMVNNAVKFKNPKEALKIKVSSHKIKNKQLEIVIEDNGKGIEKEILDNLWATVKNGNNNVEQTSFSRGLAYSKRIVEQMNGNIFIESIPGKGTIVRLRFPLFVAKQLQKTNL